MGKRSVQCCLAHNKPFSFGRLSLDTGNLSFNKYLLNAYWTRHSGQLHGCKRNTGQGWWSLLLWSSRYFNGNAKLQKEQKWLFLGMSSFPGLEMSSSWCFLTNLIRAAMIAWALQPMKVWLRFGVTLKGSRWPTEGLWGYHDNVGSATRGLSWKVSHCFLLWEWETLYPRGCKYIVVWTESLSRGRQRGQAFRHSFPEYCTFHANDECHILLLDPLGHRICELTSVQKTHFAKDVGLEAGCPLPVSLTDRAGAW